MAEVVAFRHANGVAEFTCQSCGFDMMVFQLPDPAPLCLTCRFIETEVPAEDREAVRAYLRKAKP